MKKESFRRVLCQSLGAQAYQWAQYAEFSIPVPRRVRPGVGVGLVVVEIIAPVTSRWWIRDLGVMEDHRLKNTLTADIIAFVGSGLIGIGTDQVLDGSLLTATLAAKVAINGVFHHMMNNHPPKLFSKIT